MTEFTDSNLCNSGVCYCWPTQLQACGMMSHLLDNTACGSRAKANAQSEAASGPCTAHK